MYGILNLPEIKFPEGFIWGSATAGHQVEGDNIHSQNWALEQEGKIKIKSGKACNHYEMYREDVKLIKELGHKAYRMSVEWSRIEPVEGEFCKEAVGHYIDLLNRLKEENIKVYVTLHHFTHPLWFEKKGAFHKAENIAYFERYVNYIVHLLAEYVDSWNVINEFNLYGGAEQANFKINMIKAHARGYHVIKQYTGAPVSTAHAFIDYFPYRRHDRLDIIMTDYMDWMNNEFFFHAFRTGEIVLPHTDVVYDPEVKDAMDYWSVNYYIRQMVDARLMKPESGKRFEFTRLKLIPMDFSHDEFFPEGLVTCLERLKDRPVIITENGCATDDDRFRIVHMILHLYALKEAIDRGVDVSGYLHWSLMDNYEWGSFVPRFGLVHVDFDTFKRTPKPSALFYREIIESNRLNARIISNYLKEIPAAGK